MIIEQHYDEEVLAEFLAEPSDAVTRDKHLGSCGLCLKTLDSLRGSAQILREAAVWDKTPVSAAPRSETLAFLRGMQKSMLDEDAAAAVWIKQLLAGSRETWAPRLAEHPEWRTGGMVRALLKQSDSAIVTVPADAVSITQLALAITEHLPEQPASRHLRALARYELGYALWYTGAPVAALAEFDAAAVIFAAMPQAEFDLARVDLMRAMVCRMIEHRDEAVMIASAAAEVFHRYGDGDRVAAARSATALTLQGARRIREALALHLSIVEDRQIGETWRVSALQNAALCYRDLHEFESAKSFLSRAITGFEKLGKMTDRSKSRWVFAQILVQQQRYDAALPMLREVREDFQEIGMFNDVALASLDIAEALLAAGRISEIGDACRAALDYFSQSGLTQTEPALRAIAFLQEAAAAGRITTHRIQDVRSFLLAPADNRKPLFLELPS